MAQLSILPRRKLRWHFPGIILLVIVASSVGAFGQTALPELSRAARPWEFFCAVGQRAGIFGNEGGNLEAWVYPLKIFRNFHLRFLTDGRTLPAEDLVRTVRVRPESSTIVYAGDTFQITEKVFIPPGEAGAVITLQVESSHPLEIEAVFERDFQLEWPAALGGTYSNWNADLHAFYFGEEQKKYVALMGSPTAEVVEQEYQNNYSASQESSLRLGITKGNETKVLAIAASFEGPVVAENTYKRLISEYAAEENKSARYYRDYLDHTIALKLPDAQLQQAYDWSRISVVQGLITNPTLGTGLAAGYRTSGTSQRPGFAWFFGRDSFWTALALNSEGDFANARTALQFISKYQRADGKMPHEISQGASFVPWFTGFPYAYASADATPLYIIAVNDYARESGDVAFVMEKWDSLWKAYQFLRSTYDAQGLPQNFGVGHGWVEGGPLLPVKTELYQSALGAESLRALSSLAHLAGKEDVSKQLGEEFARQQSLVNKAFWSADKNGYAFALDQNNQPVDEPSVLATVPMWFGLLDGDKADEMISQLAAPEHETDWGMRIISSRSPHYDAGGYHYGAVWPLFTGWASVGEYRYHRAFPGYLNLRSNALLALDGSLGHVTEVLSGDYYEPLSTSSPHQIWSAAMVISPMLRGLLGLQIDAGSHEVTLAPHIPADWTWFAINNLRVGATSLRMAYHKSAGEISLAVTRSGSGECTVEFSPAVSLRGQIAGVEVNGHHVEFQVHKTDVDQHVTVRFPLATGENILRIHIKNDFGLSLSSSLPPLGSASEGLRVLSEEWSPSWDSVSLQISGAQGSKYAIDVRDAAEVASVEGAELIRESAENAKMNVAIPASTSEPYPREKIIIHFNGKRQ